MKENSIEEILEKIMEHPESDKILADISGLVAKISLLKSYHDRLELTARLSDIFKEYGLYERKEK